MAPTLPPPVDSTNTLFPHTLISSEVTASLPAGFTIRPLVRDDHARGFYECLKVLTWVGGDGDGQPSAAEFRTRFDEMAAAAGTYYFLVIEWEGRVVGTGELVVEKKFIHNHGKVAHVEEIAVAREHQGKGLGLAMMRALESVAVAVGCYKSILNCGPRNEPFYAKCGFENSGIEMSQYFEEATDAYHRG
ncbi:putative glucosamine 6-phosphate acetyltransferase protein [Eutypa lata UCREL1]|uniref:Glucosamine 6-phosphate N-acetyltransferase n=1 Tax=Eutypa lata (strain UCR-EL1) TaxID=1287681 RepID=M7T782_EUTLA|nr:putative glucosamine 6-phosphate acetyltransferase protein [Eutypa lata UCREL1]